MELDPKWIRVSSILSMIPTKGVDGKWSYPMQQINPSVLEEAANRGSSVHAAISAHAKGEFGVVAEGEEGYFESYLRWEKKIKPSFAQTEKRFFLESMKLTGCVDMIANIGSNVLPTLIDFKCTSGADSVKWPIQGAFYHFLSQANGIELDKTALFIQLDSKGKDPKVHKYVITKELNSAAVSWYNAYLYLNKK